MNNKYHIHFTRSRNYSYKSVFINNIRIGQLTLEQIIRLNLTDYSYISSDKLIDIQNIIIYEYIINLITQKFLYIRPRSGKEILNYINLKIINSKNKYVLKSTKENDISLQKQIVKFLEINNFIDDEKFTKFWVENRKLNKGISIKKIKYELFQKGIAEDLIEKYLKIYNRNDLDEMKKIINKKKRLYDDQKKLINYLLRQGFYYEDIKKALQTS